ncbi:MAG: hypothetical protein A3B96_04555 [Candidatus Spechtbacteria bacterium RIFCSPHIGHO2_02_FULL_43_15b]|uniref:Uncharacterized protein n=1 Tax=Candidatus Spechtbacteria bacterium RIFCSPHIGHO2_01_FULL_43_30 TaxID=1802158 RepID=A0A1G2H6T7_9BACT|nr:MAG: hypothetical protein A2827_01275 [Candidatus Spechtbacteria bacterium RIFCSPHIGHO2_01_FULL_43_30]OGZ58613.1 MAG: hypothetical protein A3B96_04555 [Candidatus Spechtbacteria bacterium RIFCSPHIGHO2_02_FULL_43_15b]
MCCLRKERAASDKLQELAIYTKRLSHKESRLVYGGGKKDKLEQIPKYPSPHRGDSTLREYKFGSELSANNGGQL